MGDVDFYREYAVLDHTHFSGPTATSTSGYLANWEAVRARHADHQMLALKGCNPLKEYIASELHAEEEQLLGSDLVLRQHASVEVKASKTNAAGRAQHMMGNSRAWSENEKGFTSSDISATLQNGVFRVAYKGKDFFIYVFHFVYGYNEAQMTIIVWKDSTAELGKQLLAEAYTWSSTLREQMWVFHGALGGWRKDSSFYRAVAAAKESDIVLPADTVEQLHRDTQAFFGSAKLYHDLQVTWKRGILLLGPPGNGKTNMIRILLQRCKGIPALYVQSANTQGGAEMGMHAIFAKARQSAPCILILEDVETLVSGDARSFMLNQLDGIESNDGILVIATANDVSKLDAAILQRPSRFDAKYMFHLPDADLRRRFAAKWFESKVGKDRLVFDSEKAVDFDALLEVVVASTEGWSFAFLKELFMSYLLGIAAATMTNKLQHSSASVQSFLDNIDLLSKQMALTTAVDAEAKGQRADKAKGKKTSASNAPGFTFGAVTAE